MLASVYARAKAAQRIAAQHYEVGVQAKSLKAIWQRHIYPKWGICYATFLKYMRLKID